MTILLWLVIIPISVLWFFSEPVLAALVPDRRTAALAALGLRILMFGTPGVAAFETTRRFAQAQGLFHATTYVLAAGAPTSFFLNWFFVVRLKWEFAGAAAAMAITHNLLPVLMVLYLAFIDGRQCWGGFSCNALTNWRQMIALAVPGMIMVGAQFMVLEIITLAAGRFGAASMAAQGVLDTICATAFNMPFPLSIAAGTREANLIGA